MSNQDFRVLARRAVNAKIWKIPNAALVKSHLYYRNRNLYAGFSDEDHLRAAAEWLERAQDVTGNGGLAGKYVLGRGFTSAYPETTGYVIPTFLALAKQSGSGHFEQRARRAVDFLLTVQLSSGAFPAGDIGEKIKVPSVFNTAQILCGLRAWSEFNRERRVLEAASRAADWLVSVQDPDGAWRRYTYADTSATYFAHASCWLAQFGESVGHDRYREASSRHLDWVLEHQDPETGWFDRSGFTEADHRARRAFTHTIAYTLWGILISSENLGRTDGFVAVEKAAAAIARRVELSKRLPGLLDHRWRPQAAFSCLTGNAQMAQVWLRLYAGNGDGRFLNAALHALDEIKAAQDMSNAAPGIRGGIPGSYPVWGDYITMALPNWAAKFFVDALLAKETLLSPATINPHRKTFGHVIPPNTKPSISSPFVRQRLRVVMFSSRRSTKLRQMLDAWASWNFRPDMVFVERQAQPRLASRIKKRLMDDGLHGVAWKVLSKFHGRSASQSGDEPVAPDVATFCAERDIPVTEVQSLHSNESLAAVRALRPDIAIHAGAGILRPPLFNIPRLGTLNAHMGILPSYGGMNAAEWAYFEGGPVGCTVHLIDVGIDTGDVLSARYVACDGVTTIAQLRARVDHAQIDLLGDVLRFVLCTGELPPRRKCHPGEERQFFRMHREIVALLEAKLRSSSGAGIQRESQGAAEVNRRAGICVESG